MFRSLPSPAMCVALAALVIALGGAGYSATGGNFILGRTNTAETQTRHSSAIRGTAFRIDNTSTMSGATALGLFVGEGHTPFTVNSEVKVVRLNADKLDGIDSTGFLQGYADGQAIALAPNTVAFVGPVAGMLRFRYQCPFNIGGNGVFRITNPSTSLLNLFIDSGGANPDYVQLGSGGFIEYPAAAAGESFAIQAQGALGVQTALAASVHRSGSNDCHVQAQTILTP